jgi:Plasmid pRiA4b ORF-3-like protein
MSDAATSPNPTVYQLRVVLAGISPPIWRRLLVPATIAQLHDILQSSLPGLRTSPTQMITTTTARDSRTPAPRRQTLTTTRPSTTISTRPTTAEVVPCW